MNCPACGKKLTKLEGRFSRDIYSYELDFEGELDSRYKAYRATGLGTDDKPTYYCPYCGTTLAYNRAEVVTILMDIITPRLAKRFAELIFDKAVHTGGSD